MSDTLAKITELIESGAIQPPTNPVKKPIEVNFMDAVYEEPLKETSCPSTTKNTIQSGD